MHCPDTKKILHAKDTARVCQGLTVSCRVLRKTLGTKVDDVTAGGENCVNICFDLTPHYMSSSNQIVDNCNGEGR